MHATRLFHVCKRGSVFLIASPHRPTVSAQPSASGCLRSSAHPPSRAAWWGAPSVRCPPSYCAACSACCRRTTCPRPCPSPAAACAPRPRTTSSGADCTKPGAGDWAPPLRCTARSCSGEQRPAPGYLLETPEAVRLSRWGTKAYEEGVRGWNKQLSWKVTPTA